MMPNCKKLKVDRELKTTANEDIISNLPESLLHRIISFLPTRCAVSTCILSKRWEDLWKATTKLAFSLELKEPIHKYSLFVDQVLRYHSSTITSFSLCQGIGCLDASIVKAWISAAANRRVQEVNLRTFSGSVLSLPLSLCNSNTLTVLKLCSLDCLELPSEICLSSLKILHLLEVSFPDELSFNTLFSGLPKIEELNLDYCRWNFVKNVTISLPTLRRLYIDLLKNNNNEAHLLKVNAENLVYLDCTSNLNVDLFLDNMPLLSEANIYITGNDRQRKAYCAINVLAGCSYAKSLKIDGPSLKALYSLKAQGNLNNFFPTFINLTTLKINSRVANVAAAVLIDILRSAPILESVVIQEVYGGNWSRKPPPQCIEYSLRNCSVLRFGGRRADMLFVKFLLKAAKGLERLELCCPQDLCRQQEKLKDATNELKLFPRTSKRCVIEFMKL